MIYFMLDWHNKVNFQLSRDHVMSFRLLSLAQTLFGEETMEHPPSFHLSVLQAVRLSVRASDPPSKPTNISATTSQ